MDYRRLWGRAIAWGRLAASSAAAALWAAASTLPTLTALRSPWAWGAGIAAVTLLCYLPGGIRDFLRLWLTLWGATLLAGGAALAVDSLLGAPYAYACAPLGLAAAALTARFALPGWRGGVRSFRVTISRPGRKGFPALIDSGNCLTEPLSGLPVIVAGPDANGLLGMPLEALSGRAVDPIEDSVGRRALPRCRFPIYASGRRKGTVRRGLCHDHGGRVTRRRVGACSAAASSLTGENHGIAACQSESCL